MTALIKVKDRFPWRKSQIRDVLIFAGLTVLMIAAIIYGIVSPNAAWPQPVFYVVGGITLLVTLVSLIGNTTAKRGSTMYAELDPDTYRVDVWMQKPTRAIWGDKLNRGRNRGDLTQLRVVDSQRVGKYDTLKFVLEDGTNIYLPDRLYAYQAVSDFLLKFVESRNGQVPATSRETMTQLAGVLNAGRKLAPAPTADSVAAPDPTVDTPTDA